MHILRTLVLKLIPNLKKCQSCLILWEWQKFSTFLISFEIKLTRICS
jgi:hypothetical protein